MNKLILYCSVPFLLSSAEQCFGQSIVNTKSDVEIADKQVIAMNTLQDLKMITHFEVRYSDSSTGVEEVKTVKKHVRKNLRTASFQAAANLALYTGGSNAPFAAGAGVNLGFVSPLHKTPLAVEYLLQFDYCTRPSRDWYARCIGTTQDNIVSLSSGFSTYLGMGLSAILVNNRKFSLIVGPELMLEMYFLSSMTVKTGDVSSWDRGLISFGPGIKSTSYIGDQLMVYLEYIACLKSNVTYEDFTNLNSSTINTPINLNLLRAGVGFRF